MGVVELTEELLGYHMLAGERSGHHVIEWWSMWKLRFSF